MDKPDREEKRRLPLGTQMNSQNFFEVFTSFLTQLKNREQFYQAFKCFLATKYLP